jgi:purine-nucleoside phosphorylase
MREDAVMVGLPVRARYDAQHTLRDAIKRAISESRIEYRFLGLAYEKDGVQLKKSYENL